PNPTRRWTKIAEEAAAAPEKRREVRERTVRIEPPGHRQSARIYLTDLYTNGDGVMVCQCCRDAMPFQLADGSYYFEAVQFDRTCDSEGAKLPRPMPGLRGQVPERAHDGR